MTALPHLSLGRHHLIYKRLTWCQQKHTSKFPLHQTTQSHPLTNAPTYNDNGINHLVPRNPFHLFGLDNYFNPIQFSQPKKLTVRSSPRKEYGKINISPETQNESSFCAVSVNFFCKFGNSKITTSTYIASRLSTRSCRPHWL
jgi:hypothetical protein